MQSKWANYFGKLDYMETKLTIRFPKSSGVGQTWERWVGEKQMNVSEWQCNATVLPGGPSSERWKRIMRGAFRIDSKEIRASKEMTYIKYIIIYVDIFSLTNKVEEHCAFPSLLSLICGYLQYK